MADEIAETKNNNSIPDREGRRIKQRDCYRGEEILYAHSHFSGICCIDRRLHL